MLGHKIMWHEQVFINLFLSQMYEHEHHKKMTTSAIAAMLSTVLYYRRFFPYYTYNILAGIDENGKCLFPQLTARRVLMLYKVYGITVLAVS